MPFPDPYSSQWSQNAEDSLQHTASGMMPPPVIGARSAVARWSRIHTVLRYTPHARTELNQQTMSCISCLSYTTSGIV